MRARWQIFYGMKASAMKKWGTTIRQLKTDELFRAVSGRQRCQKRTGIFVLQMMQERQVFYEKTTIYLQLTFWKRTDSKSSGGYY